MKLDHYSIVIDYIVDNLDIVARANTVFEVDDKYLSEELELLKDQILDELYFDNKNIQIDVCQIRASRTGKYLTSTVNIVFEFLDKEVFKKFKQKYDMLILSIGDSLEVI